MGSWNCSKGWTDLGFVSTALMDKGIYDEDVVEELFGVLYEINRTEDGTGDTIEDKTASKNSDLDGLLHISGLQLSNNGLSGNLTNILNI